MKVASLLWNICFLLPLFCTTAADSFAQPSTGAPAATQLFKTVATLDTELFDAYNNCDLIKLSSMVSDDLEFYHDKTGLSAGKQRFLADIERYICGKVKRDLVQGTLEVYPIAEYGAVEIGRHRFHHPGHDDTEQAGEARFITLWQNKGGIWKVTRVISYDHVDSLK